MAHTQKAQPFLSSKRRPDFQTHKRRWKENKLIIGPKPIATVLARANSNLQGWTGAVPSRPYTASRRHTQPLVDRFLVSCEEVHWRGCRGLEWRIQNNRERMVVICFKTLERAEKAVSRSGRLGFAFTRTSTPPGI
jgi:hypothetical protein